MPTFSNFYDDGTPKWGGKNALTTSSNQGTGGVITIISPPVISTGENSIGDLVGSDIKTNIVGVSIKIQKTSSANILAHFDLAKISSWDISGSQILINSSDELPVTLIFISPDEAIIGDERLTTAQNGGALA